MEEYGRLGWYGRERGKGNALGAGKDDGGLWRGLEMWWYHKSLDTGSRRRIQQ